MANNPYVNKIVLANGQTLIDLTGDTVVADRLVSGYTAHGADGALVTGTFTPSSIVVSETQDTHGGTIITITTMNEITPAEGVAF